MKAKEKSNDIYEVISNDEDIRNFMNKYFNEKMKKYLALGAAVVVGKDNKEVFKMG